MLLTGMERKLPIFNLVINDEDESGVSYVALVDDPAIQRNWFAFNKQEFKFVADVERRIITGALMIADLPIYRSNASMGEFYVVFDKIQIEKCVQKFFKNGNTANVNMMHDAERQVNGVYMFESFIVDSSRGIKAPEGFTGITEGSWIGSFKVDNDDVWNNYVKTGEFKGYSVEGMFEYEPQSVKKESDIDEIVQSIEQLLNVL